MKAVAETAIAAKQKATDARQAATDVGGADDALNTAADTAEREATEAVAKADALSHQPTAVDPEKDKKVQKLKRKQGIIARELEELGAGAADTDDDEDEDDLEDPDRPLTVGDFQRMKAREAAQTTTQMAQAIEDPVARQAVQDALKRVVPSGDPQKDFTDAVAIASRDKNNKILEELARKGPAAQHRSGAGAPIRQDNKFVPTEEEARFMTKFKLTEAEILKARAQGAQK